MSDEYKDFGKLATLRYTWPGKPESVCCIDHAMQLQAVASAIGLPLQMIPLSYRVGEVPKEFPTCKQQVKAKP